MEINEFKNKIEKLIRAYHNSSAKFFYINSIDGETFSLPLGVFVSLDMTESLKTITDLSALINKIVLPDLSLEASVVEIASKKVDSVFMNTITKSDLEDISQHISSEEDLDLFQSLEEVDGEIEFLKNKILNEEKSLSARHTIMLSQLINLRNKVCESNNWSIKKIQKLNESIKGNYYRPFYTHINYKKEGDVEYRIGIFIPIPEDD